jgi:hypothetical protein
MFLHKSPGCGNLRRLRASRFAFDAAVGVRIVYEAECRSTPHNSTSAFLHSGRIGRRWREGPQADIVESGCQVPICMAHLAPADA